MTRLFGIDEWIKNFFSSNISNYLKNILYDVNKISLEVGAELGKSPESFNSKIFNSLENFSENVVMPIGILILTVVLVINLCRNLIDDRQMQNPFKVIFFFVITSVFAVVLVTNSFGIVNYILNITQVLVNKAMIHFGAEASTITGDISQFEEVLKTMETGQLFGIFLTLVLTSIILWFVRILVQVVILGRFIEIFMRISIAPIPFATFFNRDLQNTGYNFCKSIGAVTLQAVLIIVVISIYKGTLSSIAVDIGSQESVSLFLIKILGINVTLVFMLFQTKRIADSILSVH